MSDTPDYNATSPTLATSIARATQLYANISIPGVEQFQNLSFVLLNQEGHEDTLNSLSDVMIVNGDSLYFVFILGNRTENQSCQRQL